MNARNMWKREINILNRIVHLVGIICEITNLIWAGLGLNLGLRSEGMGTKRLTQGTALSLSYDIPSSSP